VIDQLVVQKKVEIDPLTGKERVLSEDEKRVTAPGAGPSNTAKAKEEPK
jgi:hypothetical protein